MKGGLKVSQISLILIGFVCASVLLLAYVKSLLLSSSVLPQNHVLQLSPDLRVKDEEALGEGSGSEQSQDSVNFESEKYPTYANSSPVIKVTEELITHEERGGIAPNITEKGDSKDVSDKKTGLIEQEIDVSTAVSSGGEHSDNFTATPERQDCNFAKGRWVIDDSRPLYSGFGCKQWLSSMWACRLTQRTDLNMKSYVGDPKIVRWKILLVLNF